jgi:hypothetical protein
MMVSPFSDSTVFRRSATFVQADTLFITTYEVDIQVAYLAHEGKYIEVSGNQALLQEQPESGWEVTFGVEWCQNATEASSISTPTSPGDDSDKVGYIWFHAISNHNHHYQQ